MQHNYGHTLLKIIYQPNEFTDFTGINLPTISELGFVPSLLYRNFNFPWVLDQILNLSPWKDAVNNMQIKYKELLNPKDISIILYFNDSILRLSEHYILGKDHSNNFVFFIDKVLSSRITQGHSTVYLINTQEQQQILLINLSSRDLTNPLDFLAKIDLNQSLEQLTTLNPELAANTQIIEIIESKHNTNCVETKIKANFRLRFTQDHKNFAHEGFNVPNNFRMIDKSAFSILDITNKHIIHRYDSQNDLLLIRGVIADCSLEILQTALTMGADLKRVDKNGQAAHHHAARLNHVPALKLFLATDSSLLNTTGQHGLSALHIACRRGNVQVVNLLLDLGAKTDILTIKNQHSALDYAIFSNNPATIKAMIDHCLKACSLGNENLINAHGQTLFHVALENKEAHEHALITLLNHNFCNLSNYLQILDRQGCSVLHAALMKNSLTTINLLLPYADILQLCTPKRDAIKEYGVEPQSSVTLAYKRYIKDKTDENLQIFELMFSSFLIKADNEQFTSMWQQIDVPLEANIDQALRKYQNLMFKTNLMLPPAPLNQSPKQRKAAVWFRSKNKLSS